MKVVVAPDSYKGSLTAIEAAGFMESGIKMADPRIDVLKIPVADGGEGTTEALINATGGRLIEVKGISDPLKRKITSFFGILGDSKTAVIETAAAAGLYLLKPEERNPLSTTSFGIGQLILKALDYDVKTIIIGLGGSATNDGGMGMAEALGVKFSTKNNEPVPPEGRYLKDVQNIDPSLLDGRIKDIRIIAASDVKNPLCGKDGAAHVYAAQKGASPEDIALLEKGMIRFAEVLKKTTGKDVTNTPGSGAAGGLGAGLMAFLGAELRPGIEVVTKYCGLEEKLIDTDLVFTGEGASDGQTAFGKVPAGIAAAAKKNSIPVICLSGALNNGYQTAYECGIDAMFSCILRPMSLEEAMEKAGEQITESAYSLMKLVIALKNNGKEKP